VGLEQNIQVTSAALTTNTTRSHVSQKYKRHVSPLAATQSFTIHNKNKNKCNTTLVKAPNNFSVPTLWKEKLPYILKR
jgi:hypothetical protein